jgi:hypothetical protein
MLQKKVKSISLMLIAISSFSYASISSAANTGSADFEIRLFNNTSINQPLHYSVTSEGQAPVEGVLPVGDDHVKLIKIDGESKDKAGAEIVVADSAGHTIWDNKVYFWGASRAFYTNTVSLDSHYNVGTNAYPSIHVIGFDIRSQS